MIADEQLTIADCDALPEGWDQPQPQTVTFRHQGREVTIDAADLRRVERKLKGKRMPKTLLQVTIKVISGRYAPESEEVAEWVRSAVQDAKAAQSESDGEVQITRKWTSDDE